MSSNKIEGGGNTRTDNAPLEVYQGQSGATSDGPDLTRRRLVRGAAAAAPVILTLRSGAAVAQVSACIATEWQPGMEPSNTCAGPGGVPKFEVDTIADVYAPLVDRGTSLPRCRGSDLGFDTSGDGQFDLCCPRTSATNTVLVTASSATSLTGCNSRAL